MRRRRCVTRPILYYTGLALLFCAGLLYSIAAFQSGLLPQQALLPISNITNTTQGSARTAEATARFHITPSHPRRRNDKQYFETETAYRDRVELESNFQYSSMLKRLDPSYFNTREGYNESYVDSLPLLRNVPDYRPPDCENLTYPASNTTVSVILNYHNEVISLLLRSIYTVLSAIPPHNLRELILVDDGSNFTAYPDLELVEPLVSQFSVPVRCFRFENNRGLIYSRVFAAKKAKGDVVLVLDSHIEMKKGFLEPLLHITDKNYKALVVPVFDFIETFSKEHWNYDGHGLGYDQYLNWIWIVNRTTKANPWQIPGILGGAYMITKRRLEEIGYFGKGLVGWGGENVELSLKNLMCGGEIWGVPCSRCLHYAASRKPEHHGGRVVASNTNNIVTVAKSFLDDHQFEEFLLGRPYWNTNLADEVAVAENRKLLKYLKCDRDYEWIRENLMDPKIESFSSKSHIAVEVMFSDQCVKVDGVDAFRLSPCKDDQPFVNQLRLSKRFELRWGRMQCFDTGWSPPRLNQCHFSGGCQRFHYSSLTKQLSYQATGLCLTVDTTNQTLSFKNCLENDPNQKFHFRTIFHPELMP